VPTVNIARPATPTTPATRSTSTQAGGGCSEHGQLDGVAHEWGHGLDDRYGGISQTNGLSEGWGDISALPRRQPDPRQRLPDRRRRHPQRQQHDAVPGAAPCTRRASRGWASRGSCATASRPRSATAGAIALTNDIVIGTIVADATTRPSAVLEVFLADDNDGNLANGTPHSPT
jgi:hypothetical protein